MKIAPERTKVLSIIKNVLTVLFYFLSFILLIGDVQWHSSTKQQKSVIVHRK